MELCYRNENLYLLVISTQRETTPMQIDLSESGKPETYF